MTPNTCPIHQKGWGIVSKALSIGPFSVRDREMILIKIEEMLLSILACGSRR